MFCLYKTCKFFQHWLQYIISSLQKTLPFLYMIYIVISSHQRKKALPKEVVSQIPAVISSILVYTDNILPYNNRWLLYIQCEQAIVSSSQWQNKMHTMFEKCMKKMQSGKDKDHVTIYFPNSRTLVSVNSRSFEKLKVHLELVRLVFSKFALCSKRFIKNGCFLFIMDIQCFIISS